ncbi:MAG: hypothetical protein SGILL_006654 [Bacillariaceae sp.]
MNCNGESCPPGLQFEACPDPNNLPCDVVEKCDQAVSCYVENCGGCRAIWYDAAGHRVCTGEEEEGGDFEEEDEVAETDREIAATQTEIPIYCQSDVACQTTEYCASGTCSEVSRCSEKLDCYNPANNPYAVLACIGYVDCTVDGFCQTQCGDSFCPDGQEPTPCDAWGCDVAECPEAVSCHNMRCNDCSPIYWNAAGEQVCTGDGAVAAGVDSNSPATENNDPPDSIQFLPCNSDADCMNVAVERSIIGQYYCGRGFCYESGTCGIDNDCENPSNEYYSVFCVGYNTCDSGVCGRMCGPTCADGSSVEVLCETDPCRDGSPCPASASCQRGLCGRCSAVYYDTVGNVMASCGGGDDEGEHQFDPPPDQDNSNSSADAFRPSLRHGALLLALLVHYMVTP